VEQQYKDQAEVVSEDEETNTPRQTSFVGATSHEISLSN
jgi:hypothetical protein